MARPQSKLEIRRSETIETRILSESELLSIKRLKAKGLQLPWIARRHEITVDRVKRILNPVLK